MSSPSEEIGHEVRALTWYHTIELPGGIVTPGEYDTRAAAARIPFPQSLAGLRCLDVGTHDGFWAFEMERRGAREIIAIDLDDATQVDFSEPVPPPAMIGASDRPERPRAFACAHRALGSSVERRDLSVYRLPDSDIADVDFAFIGTLLLHLRDPVLALTAIHRVLRPGGRLLVNDAVSLGMSLRHPRMPVHQLTLLPGKPFWWIPNVTGLRRYAEKAGFTVEQSGGPYFLPRGPGSHRPPPALSNPLRRMLHHRGMVHGWVLARA